MKPRHPNKGMFVIQTDIIETEENIPKKSEGNLSIDKSVVNISGKSIRKVECRYEKGSTKHVLKQQSKGIISLDCFEEI
jgi:hypothetical protein